jgi:hypothetical protein
MAYFCEHGNELSDYTKAGGRVFLVDLRNY